MDENQKLPAYRLDTDQAMHAFGTDRKQGLEASEVQKRLGQFGPNQLKELHKESALHKYLRQYKDLMIILLTISGVISFGLGDDRTGTVLFVIVLLNTALGFFQEFKAEKLMESLEKLVVPTAKVIRSGKLNEIASTELVPGDIAYIEEGDSVPADMRIVEESELSTNDFALTGESNPSRKFTHAISADVELANRHNLVFMGTTVATGHGYGVVIASGMNTELGRIASLSADTKNDLSPLQKELNHTATRVTQGTVILCALLLPISIQVGLPFKEAFLFALGIASSLIPQGLPAEINTSLAQAANKLARARALVKKLSAVETLGATSVICTDKTGTLTKNEMTVEQLHIGKAAYLVTGSGYQSEGKIQTEKHTDLTSTQLKEMEIFFTTGALASNAHISPPDEKHPTWYCLGDPTEGALITLANKVGIDTDKLNEMYPELKEFSFDSARKRMSSIRKWGDGKQIYVFVKGAPESILEKCNSLWDHGHTRPLHKQDSTTLLDINQKLAESAMRNLAFAYKVLPANTDLSKLTMDQAESDLTYLGMVSMIDPVREEVYEAMQAAHGAHIKISVITGDYAVTAKAIATKAGLGNTKIDIPLVTGEELRKLSDTQVLQLVNEGSVIFSRVAPEDKLRIVGLVKDSGKVVAVTGDGINDAPALKRADIGVAMGKTGTDVAKQSADIVLLDDSFHTLVGAIQQGRVIFQNIKKATLSCFTSNTAELVANLFSLGAASLLHIPLALGVMEILAIDLVAELFPIAALGWDPADSDVMVEQPRNPKRHILDRLNIADLMWCGLLIGGLAFGNYLLYFHRAGVDPSGFASGAEFHLKATTLTYLTIVLCQLGNIMQRRSHKGLFTKYQFYNKEFWFAMSLSMFCVFNIIYNPFVSKYMRTGPLNLYDWGFALAAAAVFLTIREIQRLLAKKAEPALEASL